MLAASPKVKTEEGFPLILTFNFSIFYLYMYKLTSTKYSRGSLI